MADVTDREIKLYTDIVLNNIGGESSELNYADNFANGYITNIRNAGSYLLDATSYLGNITGNILHLSVASDMLLQAAESTKVLAQAEIKKRLEEHRKDLTSYMQSQIAALPKDIAFYTKETTQELLKAGLADIVREIVNEREGDSEKEINKINNKSQKDTINKITTMANDAAGQLKTWMKDGNDAVSEFLNKYLPLGAGEKYVFEEKVVPMINKYDEKAKDYCDNIKISIHDLEQNFAKSKGKQIGEQAAEKTIQAARKKQKYIVDNLKVTKRKVLIDAKTKIKAALFALLARIGG